MNTTEHPQSSIIGAGPTGLTAATLLARHGVECLVLDRWESIYPQPRAVHLDDEVYRILATLGVGDEFAAISRPCHGLRLVRSDMTVLAELAARLRPGPARLSRGQHVRPAGARGAPARQPGPLPVRHPARRHRGHRPHPGRHGPVRVDVTDRVHGTSETLLAAYVLGCDGANSIARTAIDAHMPTWGSTQRWLVVDVDTDGDLGQWEGVPPGVRHPPRRDLHARRPRPATGGSSGSTPPRPPTTTATSPTCTRSSRRGPRRHRSTGCTSSAWRSTPSAPSSPTAGATGGSSCSATPPTSPRPSSDRAWAPGCVTRPTSPGNSPPSSSGALPDRRPGHLRGRAQAPRPRHDPPGQAIGTIMTGGGEVGELVRAARRAAPAPHPRTQAARPRQPDTAAAPHRLVARPRLRRTLAGQLCPNASVGDGRRFDDLATGRFALVTTTTPTPAEQFVIDRCGATVVTGRRRHGSGPLAAARPCARRARAARTRPSSAPAATSPPSASPPTTSPPTPSRRLRHDSPRGHRDRRDRRAAGSPAGARCARGDPPARAGRPWPALGRRSRRTPAGGRPAGPEHVGRPGTDRDRPVGRHARRAGTGASPTRPGPPAACCGGSCRPTSPLTPPCAGCSTTPTWTGATAPGSSSPSTTCSPPWLPATTPFISPAGRKALLDSRGASAARGLRNLAADLAGAPRVPTTVRPDAFAVGEGPRRHPRARRAAHRDVRADPVHAPDADGAQPPTARRPACDQQVLRRRSRARDGPSWSTSCRAASRSS